MSSECIADTGALNADKDDFSVAIEGLFESCPQAETIFGNSITVDYSVCDPGFESLTEACTSANGEEDEGVLILLLIAC